MLIVYLVGAYPQDEDVDTLQVYLEFDSTDFLSCFPIYFPPFFIQYSMELKSFLRSCTFMEIRKRYGDRRAVDAIFIQAMKLTGNNTAVSLLFCAISSFDHRIVGLKVPVFALFFPLSNESEEEFNQRVANLPKWIYSDSPYNNAGDRDKLQHFFGSAFIAYLFESRHPAERFSDLIEQGEKAVIVDGVLDDRDILANRQGQEFGIALLMNNHRLPSDFLVTSIILPSNNKNDDLIDSTNSTGEK